MSPAELSLLVDVARHAVAEELQHVAKPTGPGSYPDVFEAHRASFVTLKKRGHLRGCIGTLKARRPLLDDVRANAVAAATCDPRFGPLLNHELAELEISVAVLSPLRPLSFQSHAELLRQIRAGVHGLVLDYQGHQATFLPSVWDAIADKNAFVSELRRKAGIDDSVAITAINASIYTTQCAGTA